MGLSTSLTIKKDATSVAAAGGTDLVLTPNGLKVDAGIQLADMSVADVRARFTATLKARPAVFLGGNRYSKWKRTVSSVLPKYNAITGEMEFLFYRTELEGSVSFTAAEITETVNRGTQIVVDSESAGFIQNGSLS